MSNREVEVSVQAEGVDEATGELAGEDAAAGGGGGGGDGGRSGLRGALRGGLIGGLLSQVSSITAVLQTILGLVNAFIAPFAIMGLRLIAPVMRRLLGVLPQWTQFLNQPLEKQLEQLLLRVSTAAQILLTVVVAIRAVRDFVQSLPSRLDDVLDVSVDVSLPDFGIFGSGDDGAPPGSGVGSIGRGQRGGSQPTTDGLFNGPLVELGGGLGAFVDRVQNNGSVDFF